MGKIDNLRLDSEIKRQTLRESTLRNFISVTTSAVAIGTCILAAITRYLSQQPKPPQAPPNINLYLVLPTGDQKVLNHDHANR